MTIDAFDAGAAADMEEQSEVIVEMLPHFHQMINCLLRRRRFREAEILLGTLLHLGLTLRGSVALAIALWADSSCQKEDFEVTLGLQSAAQCQKGSLRP